MNPAVLAFIAWLVAQGIPCTGYSSVTGNGTTDWPPAAITLTFDKSATQKQMDDAYALVNSFVYEPNAPVVDSAIEAAKDDKISDEDFIKALRQEYATK